MKRLYLLFIFSSLAFTSFGQGGVKEITAAEFNYATTKSQGKALSAADKAAEAEEIIENKINKGIDFGASLGFNSVFRNLYEARISPLDNKLKITGVPTVAFLLSTGVSVPLFGAKCPMGGRYYRKLNSDGSNSGVAYYVPYGLCAVATINLATFNSAATGGTYNLKLDGGLGLGFRFNDNVQLTLTAEMISYRLPRQFLLDEYRDKILLDAAGKPVAAISTDDDDYFSNRYLPSVSIKLFYLFAYKPVNQ